MYVITVRKIKRCVNGWQTGGMNIHLPADPAAFDVKYRECIMP
jgi:hypothetical protein